MEKPGENGLETLLMGSLERRFVLWEVGLKSESSPQIRKILIWSPFGKLTKTGVFRWSAIPSGMHWLVKGFTPHSYSLEVPIPQIILSWS